MTQKNKKESALGKGLDALIRKDYLDEDKKAKSIKEEETNALKADKDIKIIKEEKISSNLNSSSPDAKLVNAVLIEVHKNPRISLWSARSAAVLRYLKKTRPEFSISNEASQLIEEAVREQYPEIWALFEKEGL